MNLFIQLIQDEKVNIPIEHYKDFYALSEYFCIPRFIAELDNLSQNKLFKDLNFTIQILIECQTSNKDLETKLTSKIENFLKERINYCIENVKFGYLPLPTICRILDKSKENINHNLLIDFIFESVKTRYALFKFVELQELTEDKVEKLINFFDEQEENSKKMYLEFMPFNLSFIKDMRSKFIDLFSEINQMKKQLDQEKKSHERTKKELKEIKIKQEKTEKELKEVKIKQEKTEKELKEVKIKQEKTEKEIKEVKIKQEKTEKELKEVKFKQEKTEKELKEEKIKQEKTEKELDQFKKESIQTKEENSMIKKHSEQSILVSGDDDFNLLGEKPNNQKEGHPFIFPPIKLSFNPSSLRSYSVYGWHSVIITSDGSLKGIGYNIDGRISSSLKKMKINHFTDFCIKDKNGQKLDPISAVCCFFGTLYMFSKIKEKGRQLVLCDCNINDGDPVFLGIGDQNPVALFLWEWTTKFTNRALKIINKID